MRDSKWFKKPKQFQSDNWVMRFNVLKRLYSLMLGYFQDILGKTIHFDIELTLIAKDGNLEEMAKFATLVVTLLVQSEKASFYVDKIQQLDTPLQAELMFSIEAILQKVTDENGLDDSLILENENEELKAANQRLLERIQLLESGSSGSSRDNNQLLLRLEQTEMEKANLQVTVSKQVLKINSLNEKMTQLSQENMEASRMKEVVQEFGQLADKLQKTEAMIEKYKKKGEEYNEQKRLIEALEEQLEEANQKSSAMEEQFRKVAGLKPLIDTYKSQIASLEEKNAVFHVENVNLQFQLKDLKNHYKRLEAERDRDTEKIMELQDQLKDMEFHSATSVQSDLEQTKLNIALKELQMIRAQKQEQALQLNKIVVLENLLEDANKLKTKFQEDYQTVYKNNLHLQNKVEQLSSVPAGQGPRDAIARLSETESKLRKMKSESDMLNASRRVTKRVSMMTIAEKRDSMSSNIPADRKQLQDENRNMHSRVELLEQENQLLQLQMDELRARNSELEKTTRYINVTSALKASLSVLESTNPNDDNTKSLVTATQKLNQFTEQNNQLHTALKQAKDLILSQEKRIKQLSSSDSSENFVDAVQALETALKKKEAELARAVQEVQDTRTAARREQRLIMSAWYELGLQLQRKNRPDTQTSWLSQQRNNLAKAGFSFPF